MKPFLREQLGVADTFERRGIRTNLGKRPGTKNRFPDAVTIDDLGKTIHESKVGYVRWSPRVRDQILKDIDIVNSGTDDVTRAVWHFFPSAAGDTVGADPQVLELLADNGIEFVVWLP